MIAREPAVVHVDRELNSRVTLPASDLETCVTGLVDESEYTADA